MKTRAAVAFAPKQPLEIVELDLEGPRAGEVMVEIMAIGAVLGVVLLWFMPNRDPDYEEPAMGAPIVGPGDVAPIRKAA